MNIRIIFPLFLLALVFGCKNSTTMAPFITGELKGTVGLYDSHGNEVADKSGVLVQVEGSNFSAISDAAGNWNINDLPSQTYTLTFSKSSYGTVKNTSFSFLGGGTVSYGSRVYLYKPVEFKIILDSVSAVSSASAQYDNFGFVAGHISGAFLADSTIIQAYVLFGTSPTITLGDTSTYTGGLLFNNERHALHKKGSDLVFQDKNWESCGPDGWAKSGMTVYLQAFGITNEYSPKYYDVKTDKWIYPNPVPSSPVVSVIIP